jgi:hypothetical protein
VVYYCSAAYTDLRLSCLTVVLRISQSEVNIGTTHR